MHYRLFPGLFVVVAILVSCQQKIILDHAEACIQEHPDSALTILEGIPQGSIKNPGSRAKYALLYSMALDKNYIDVKSDSIISPAVRWYERFGSKRERMLAYYYAGKVEFNNGNYPRSVCYGQKALSLAAKKEEGYYQGLSDWLIADTYYANHNYVKAKAYYSRAESAFENSGLQRYSNFSKCETAKTMLVLGEL